MNKQQYKEYVARTNPTRWRMTCDPVSKYKE